MVTRDSIGCRKTSSKDLGLGPHFTAVLELCDLEQALTSLGLRFLIRAMGRAVPPGREVERLG